MLSDLSWGFSYLSWADSSLVYISLEFKGAETVVSGLVEASSIFSSGTIF